MTAPSVTSLHETAIDHPTIDIAWLTRPRWAATAAFLVTLLAAHFDVVQEMPALPIVLGASITALSNLVAQRLGRAGWPLKTLTMRVLLFDAALLTGVLYFSGGASNPLTSLYLLPIALAAVMLPARYAWILAGVTVSAFFLLFFSPSQAHEFHEGQHQAIHGATQNSGKHHVFNLHLQGMWVAFTLTAVSMAYFVTQVAQALRAREAELTDVRTRAHRAERVAALAGLAASTAHELGTPLASIQLAASEMAVAIQRGNSSAALAEDVDLVRNQVRRCRDILDAMLNEAGETVGEPPTPQDARALFEEAIASLPQAEQTRVTLTPVSGQMPMRTPHRIVTQALHNLLRNALDASPMDRPVRANVTQLGDQIRFTVSDEGTGMDAETLQRALEPFVTSKPGRGKGLGLFLTSSVAERLGGALQLHSQPGAGTQAVLTVMADAITEGAPPAATDTER